ncbi:MAG: hypothetical protein M3416_00145 [Acidobacteriota bacterium]|nr:hypothetical protein [Acidobacteriota bacterium]
MERFPEYLPSEADEIWARALSKFVTAAPWRYWDPPTVEQALNVLENSAERTQDAITFWSRELGVGVDNLFRNAPAAEYEESLDVTKPRDLLRLATEFHPDYLRCAEHVFANLLAVYWAVLKKGSVEGRFDLRGAVSLVESKHHELLIAGYDDRVRNAIAHGETVFRGEGVVQYGPDAANYRLAPSEFLSRYDTLWRTSNALTVALLLFLARNHRQLTESKKFTLPPAITVFLAAVGVERPGLTVLGAIESEYPRAGKQLHLSIKSTSRWRIQVFYDCARLSMYLLEHGAAGYSRFVFDIDQGQSVSSLVMVKADRLADLLEKDAPFTRLSEAFDENMLLWFEESKFRHLVRSWKSLFSSHFRLSWSDIQRNWDEVGFRRGSRRYRIRKVENASTAGIRRIRVTAVLRHPSYADDREAIKEIVQAIIKRASKLDVRTDPSGLERRWSTSGRPSYIWVSLYRLDGTVRWLSAGGWQGGNLVTVAEKVRRKNLEPVFVPKPEEVWQGIRLRYSMDMEAYAKAMSTLAEVVSDIWAQDEVNKSES